MSLFAPMFSILNQHGVRYVVVGGVATVLHGYARLTIDLDLVIDLSGNESKRAIEALTSAGLVPRLPIRASDFADPEIRRSWIAEKNMVVFSWVHPSDPMLVVDVFVEAPIPFDDLWRRAEAVTIEGNPVRIASIRDLITMKKAAARPQDLLDIEALEAIERKKKDGR